jgi:hypothetical protein
MTAHACMHACTSMTLVKRFEHLAVVQALSFCVQRLQQPVNLLLHISGCGSGRGRHDDVPQEEGAYVWLTADTLCRRVSCAAMQQMLQITMQLN